MTGRTKRRIAIGAASSVALALAGTFLGALGLAACGLLIILTLGVADARLGGDDGDDKPTVRRSFWVGLLLPFGLVLLFVAERIIGAGSELIGLWRLLSIICLAAALAWRAYGLSRAANNQRRVEVALMIATVGVLAAVGLYALSTNSGLEWLGVSGSARERMSGTLAVLWPTVLWVSLSALLFMEHAYRGMPVEQAIEPRRVSAAAGSGLALSLSFVFVASMNFVATERDITEDLSYFKTTEPSEQSAHMVAGLDEPIEVVLLYPAVNEVLDRLRPYFETLADGSPQLSVRAQDHALSYGLAQQHRIPRNGFVVLLRGEGEGQQAEQFEVGLELETARSRLRTLDARFQQHFARLTTRPRDLYLTVGHHEHSASPLDGDTEADRLGELQSALERSNIQMRGLGVAEGLANEVPDGARAVAVVGPRQPFMPEEAQSLLRYVERGGRLMVFVDPDADHGLDPLLAGLGLSIPRGVLHSSTRHMRRRTGEADRSAVFSNAYSAHPTVTLANRNRSRVVTVFLRGGAILRNDSAAQLSGVNVTFPLRTDSGFWLDLDDDHARGPAEAEDRFNMIAAVTVPGADGEEGRAVVIADGDFITDQLIGNRGNAFVLMDTVNWLVGEEHVLGPTQTEEDVPIAHSRDEDKAWFYATSFGMPLPLLIAGAWLSRRRRRGKKTRGLPSPVSKASSAAATPERLAIDPAEEEE